MTWNRLHYLLLGGLIILFFTVRMYFHEKSITKLPGRISMVKKNQRSLSVECYPTPRNMLDAREPNMTVISPQEVEHIVFVSNIHKVKSVVSHINNELNMNETTKLRETLNKFAIDFNGFVYLPGGHWKPKKYDDPSRVALIIPFRNREQMLGIFLRRMVPFLLRQRLQFAIFVVEQANNLKFNRGMLANVGFKESLRFEDWDCIILHDIDFLPRYNNNSYTCKNMPRHLMSGIEKRPKLYFQEFNGVTGFSRQQFVMMNGAPNRYWGWGGEDHDLRTRAEEIGFNIFRTEWPYGYYDHTPHQRRSYPEVEHKWKEFNQKAKQYISKDGLSNLNYPKPEIKFHSLYIHIKVNISKLPEDI
ncbi:Beta-1,4-galactosyltransferase 5 [Holothuria leucospilota]|uniref:Beta-1,4-galactosyltransferase n=1 Tax=Holothuria leucospilota TaxID=206669 RepID=A0A9Q1H2C8_HOLLE|nr:Beta-1,4-galactosyltransferase 5 [Holothuria leucospilota]